MDEFVAIAARNTPIDVGVPPRWNGFPLEGMDWLTRRVGTILLALLGLALGLRLVAAVVVQQSLGPGQICLIAGDAEGYWELGRKLSRGQDYAIHDPPRRVLRMPGFPLLLALCQLVFGENLWGTRIVLAILGTACCGLVYGLGRELFDVPTALAATALVAIWPTMILFSVLVLSETCFAGALLASLIAGSRLLRLVMRRPASGEFPSATPESARRVWSSPAVIAFVTGILVGVATLVRPTWLLVGPAFSLAVLFTPSPWIVRLRGAALVLLGLAVMLAPWTIRNAFVTGHFVPTTLWVGPSLYDGLNPRADGSSHMEFVEKDGVYRRMSEYGADRFYRREAIRFVQDNPGRAVQLAFLKLGRYWSPWPNAQQFRNPLFSVGLTILFGGMMSLAAVGLWRVRRDVVAWAVPLSPVLYFAAVHSVFVGSLRYRLPAEYPLMLLTAAGLIFVVRRSTL